MELMTNAEIQQLMPDPDMELEDESDLDVAPTSAVPELAYDMDSAIASCQLNEAGFVKSSHPAHAALEHEIGPYIGRITDWPPEKRQTDRSAAMRCSCIQIVL